MQRYLKVPVEVKPYYKSFKAKLVGLRDGALPAIGFGKTEDEAFEDLKRKLGYEEVK